MENRAAWEEASSGPVPDPCDYSVFGLCYCSVIDNIPRVLSKFFIAPLETVEPPRVSE